MVAETEELGVYRVRWDGRSRDAIYAVNLLDPVESDIRVPETVRMGDRVLEGTAASALVDREFTSLLVAVALLLLSAEWLIYLVQR